MRDGRWKGERVTCGLHIEQIFFCWRSLRIACHVQSFNLHWIKMESHDTQQSTKPQVKAGCANNIMCRIKPQKANKLQFNFVVIPVFFCVVRLLSLLLLLLLLFDRMNRRNSPRFKVKIEKQNNFISVEYT